ncbi:MAG: potassium channel family protein [Planctomycetota bacterium]
MVNWNFRRNLTILVAGLFIGGTCGYVLIEGWSVFDAVYMTMITLSTVGYGETQELTTSGRAFTSVLIACSVLCMACWTAGITSVIVSGELSGSFRRKKEKKMIRDMNGHTIVCGGGLLARTVVDKLRREQKQLVVITDDDTEEISQMRELYPEVPFIEGNPQSELLLAEAGILKASSLVAALDSDFSNLLIAITGRGISEKLQVICCAKGNELASRMFKVGANEVICPQVLGGEQVADLIA